MGESETVMERTQRRGNVLGFMWIGMMALWIVPGFGAPQSVLAVGGVATLTLPSTAPWTTIGLSTNAMRWELRVHDFGSDWRAYPSFFVNLGPMTLLRGWTSNVAQASIVKSPGNADQVYNGGPLVVGCCNNMSDVLVRVQRDVANNQYTLEICNASGGGCLSGTAHILSYGAQSWANWPISVNGTGKVAFIRWFSGVVPIGSPIPNSGVLGDLGDWEFEGNVLDSSGHGLTFSGVPFSYSATPTYPPTCNAGVQQTFRAGYPATLDGSGSFSSDGGTALSYVWQLVSGPPGLSWSSHSVARPQLRGLVFGSYVFQLTVTDSSNQSSSCTVKDGAVATDNNDIVITNNSAVDTLLGPMVRWGANPWPWYDNRHKAAADNQIAEMEVQFPAWWDTPGPGTVTVTNGSATVVGVGTTFTTTFCQGPSQPTVRKDGYPIIAVWHPLGAGTGRRMEDILSCTDDTHMTLRGATWNSDGTTSQGSGLTYAADPIGEYSLNWEWGQQAAPANYYDNVAAYYALYYRSGIDDYLTAARTWADRFWESPMIDQGIGPGGFSYSPRGLSAMGLVLRALDGRPEMWTGLHSMWNSMMGLLAGYDAAYGLIYDEREEGYQLAMVSYCALFDTDATYKSTCKTAIVNSFPAIWTPFKFADGSWPSLTYGSLLSWYPSSTSATLTNGSTTVTGVGTTWGSSDFPARIWFMDPYSRPKGNTQGDPVAYTVTFVNSAQLTLDRPYEGTSGSHGWQISPSAVGWVSQPFAAGILSTAFDLAAKAVADVSPTTATLAHSYNVAAANWIKDIAYWPSAKGLYYFAGSVDCPGGPLAGANVGCVWGMDAAASRVLSAEAIRGVMLAYAYNGDPALKAFADTLYNAMWGKTGTCPSGSTLCVSDGVYLTGMDDGQYMISGGPPTNGSTPWKWFGQFFGWSGLSSWPGYRAGGLKPAIGERVYIGANLPGVPGATKIRVAITDPSGSTTTTDCNALPCAVTVDSRQGDSLMSIQYLSAAGAVLASSRTPLIGGQ